jgi:hypothetical protein
MYRRLGEAQRWSGRYGEKSLVPAGNRTKIPRSLASSLVALPTKLSRTLFVTQAYKITLKAKKETLEISVCTSFIKASDFETKGNTDTEFVLLHIWE